MPITDNRYLAISQILQYLQLKHRR